MFSGHTVAVGTKIMQLFSMLRIRHRGVAVCWSADVAKVSMECTVATRQ